MVDITGMEEKELSEYITGLGEPKFRARQLFKWLHKELAYDFDTMTDLPLKLRERLKREAEIKTVRTVSVLSSKNDGTKKYLFSFNDGELAESVLMRHSYGNSVCISSQAGCAMGCRFCASAIGGFVRNLSVSEMLGQVYEIRRRLNENGERISHIVVMGTGEPLLNLDSLLPFIRILSDEKGLNISKRNFTISTCGIVPGIKRLSEEGLPVTLALSLHASTQEKRKELMPIASKYPLDEVISACRGYFEKTGRRETYEYALIGGVNDSPEDAKRLSKLLGRGAHINLIPLNAVKERKLHAPDGNRIKSFSDELNALGLNSTVRRSMGADIDSACGQLRSRPGRQDPTLL